MNVPIEYLLIEIKTNMIAKWFWNNSDDPWNPKKESWKEYHDLQNSMIEHALLNKFPEINLGHYSVNFKHLIQYENQNKFKQRKVKRVIQNKETTSEREDRFSFHSKSQITFAEPDYYDLFCFPHVLEKDQFDWYRKQEFTPDLVQKAADGTIQLGQSLTIEQKNPEFLAQAKYFADLLISQKHQTKEEIAKVVINIYSKESFLYKELNRALRECDKTKPYLCYFQQLLCYSLGFLAEISNYLIEDGSILYRGTNLSEIQKQEYFLALSGNHPKLFKGYFTWYGFTSATKNRALAEKFGNTLFIIKVERIHYNYYPCPVQIETISDYGYEQEVLSLPSTHYKVTDIQQQKNKLLIYLSETVIGD